MHVAGVSSWSAQISDSTLLELPLFVRDQHGLAGGEVPPLIGPVRTATMGADETRHASAQWAAWWRRSLAAQFAEPPRDVDARERAQCRIAVYRAVCDPPDFDSLVDSPELRRLVVTSHPPFRAWEHSTDRPSTRPEWELIRRVAEDVAFDRQVDVGRVQAKIAIVMVTGVWWQRVGPGQVVCSPAAAVDALAATALLWDAFDSYVRAGERR